MVQIDRRAGKVILALGEYRLLLGLVCVLGLVCFVSGLALGLGLRPSDQGALVASSDPAAGSTGAANSQNRVQPATQPEEAPAGRETGASQTVASETVASETVASETVASPTVAGSESQTVPSTESEAPQRFGVRVGIFSAPENAAGMERRLLANGYIPSVVVHYDEGKALRYVYVGVTTTEESAEALADVIALDLGLESWIDRLAPDPSKQ